MRHPRNGAAPAVVDVGHRAGYGSRDGDPTDEGHNDIGHPLRHELCIGAVALPDDPIGNASGEERLDGTKQRDGEGG